MEAKNASERESQQQSADEAGTISLDPLFKLTKPSTLNSKP